MSRVRSKDTRFELDMRKRLHSLGFRYRLHRKDLPGRPDIVFPRYSAAIFINGCFWHLHRCYLSSIPRTKSKWWKAKLDRNHSRDGEAVESLKKLGWRVMILWECGIRRPGVNSGTELMKTADKAAKFLLSSKQYQEIPKTPYFPESFKRKRKRCFA